MWHCRIGAALGLLQEMRMQCCESGCRCDDAGVAVVQVLWRKRGEARRDETKTNKP